MNPTLSKTKREAIVSETAGASELPVVGMKKKKKSQEWSCTLCHVSATCEQGLKDHLQGKKHKKAAFDLKVRNTSRQGKKSKGKERGKRRGKKKRTSRARVEKNGA
ncbi:hypothetical protein L1049_004394 [Liquidambar formosana]|uniref:U1-type domain-containing protein n=1 Tax=Liquidambar formosana TaxID=63359 RepID=A0AAP0RTS0_LIQFO